MAEESAKSEELLPQPLGEFRPIDVWQNHINQIFYGLKGDRVREYYQTFASADYRLAYALAADYYEKVQTREKKQKARTDAKTHTGTLTIHEWGCGNGNLAVCFLDQLKNLDKDGSLYPRIRYVLIDSMESVLERVRANPDLAKHQDQVTFLCADVQDLKTIEAGTVDRIICNELWGELPTKLVLRHGGELEEEHIRPNVSENKTPDIENWTSFCEAFGRADCEALKSFPFALEDVIWEREYQKVKARDLPFRKVLTDFLRSIDEEVLVPANIGAGASIKEAARVLASDAIGFSSFDAGAMDRAVLNNPEKPCYTVHGGQLSFVVNFAFLEEVVAQAGAYSVRVEPQREFVGQCLGTNVVSLMDVLASHPTTQSKDSWELDELILSTIHVLNAAYRSPYHRKVDFPVRPETPSDKREKLDNLLRSLKNDGVPDTIAYLTEEEVFGVLSKLEPLGYDREAIRVAFTIPPQPVDYFHFFLFR